MDIIFKWDEGKNKLNKIKHHVDFETAALVFKDPFALFVQDRHENGEERWQAIGSVGGRIVVLVAHTVVFEIGGEIIRIISARKATIQEKKRYEKQAI